MKNLLWTILELIQLYLYAIGSLVHKLFVKLFPASAALFALLFTIGLEFGVKDGLPANTTSVVITLLVFVILSLLYIVDKLHTKVKESEK
ncbi:MAG: hypothetical protein ACI4HO_02275 [Ruminococcus sp.]